MSEYLLFVLSAAVSLLVNAWGLVRGRREPRRILVVKLDHLGDVVLATPALRALREGHPDAEIDLLVAPGSAPAVARNPAVHRVLAYRSPRFARRTEAGALETAADGVATIRDVARAGFDTIVELRGDGRTLLLPPETLWISFSRQQNSHPWLAVSPLGRITGPRTCQPQKRRIASSQLPPTSDFTCAAV